MSANDKSIEEFNNMFDLPSDKSDDDNEQAEEYGHSTESTDSFESQASEISEKIQESESKGYSLGKEDPHDVIKDVIANGVDDFDVVLSPISKVVEELTEEDDIFDSTPAVEEPVVEESFDQEIDDIFDDDIFDSTVAEELEEESPEDPIDDDIFDDIDIEVAPEEEVCSKSSSGPNKYGEIGSGDDRIDWTLESPSAMYNSFYQKKRDLLFKYMVGGQVEYKRWTRELEEANVVIRGEVFDHQLIIDQMEAVQQHRERVKSIHVRVNNQYFTFKRFVEMMRGFLARIEYLKPVLKQEGLIMEHMRDIELYYARLEALHDSATKTEKHLAAAFDTLSRKCTICMELKPAERIDIKKSSSASAYVPHDDVAHFDPETRASSSEFDEFDDLPSNAQAAPIGHKTGAIGWGDI